MILFSHTDPMSMSMPSSAMANSPYQGGGAMGGGGGGMSLLERTAMEDDERTARGDSTAISMDGLMGGSQAQSYARQDQVQKDTHI